jgi:hypothetical protein
VLRHCFGTYWLAVHKNRAALAEQMGNSAKIIGQHYRRGIQPHVAHKYWQLQPIGTGAKVIAFDASVSA